VQSGPEQEGEEQCPCLLCIRGCRSWPALAKRAAANITIITLATATNHCAVTGARLSPEPLTGLLSNLHCVMDVDFYSAILNL